MDVPAIVTKALLAAGASMGIGALIGAAVAVSKESSRVERKQAMAAKLQPMCAQTPLVRAALLAFAEQPRAHAGLLGQLGRRCENLLLLAGKLHEAAPDTVNPRVTTAAYKMQDAISQYMTDFFTASSIPVVRSETTPGARVPVNRDLHDCAQSLSTFMDGLVYNISITVKAKMEQAVAERA